jgi:aminoglycoside phosphotransferase (APT) family kinase protein
MIHQSFGHGNLVFALPDHQPPLVAKTSDRVGAFEYTESNLRQLKNLGVPVPKLVGTASDGVISVLVLEWIPGQDLAYALPSMTAVQRRTLAGQIVEIQRQVARLPVGAGFGWTPIDKPGEFSSWRDVVYRDLHGLSHRFVTEIEPLFAVLEADLKDLPAVPFLDDLTVKNVIIDEGRLQGVVDLDHICYGDPLYWLALAETTVMLDVGDVAMDYCDELRRLWPTCPRLNLYEAMFAATFLDRDLAPDQAMRMERFFDSKLCSTR